MSKVTKEKQSGGVNPNQVETKPEKASETPFIFGI
jgi:hypothetical protein